MGLSDISQVQGETVRYIVSDLGAGDNIWEESMAGT